MDRHRERHRDGEEFKGDSKDCFSQECLIVTLALRFLQLFITTTEFSGSLNPIGNKMG